MSDKPASIQVLELAFEEARAEYFDKLHWIENYEAQHADVLGVVKDQREHVEAARKYALDISEAIRSLGYQEPSLETDDSGASS